MEYEYYTPPNTEPIVIEGLAWNQELSMLEAQHWMATLRLDQTIEEQRSLEPIESGGAEGFDDPEQKDLAERLNDLANRATDLRAAIKQLEDQIMDKRAARDEAAATEVS